MEDFVLSYSKAHWGLKLTTVWRVLRSEGFLRMLQLLLWRVVGAVGFCYKIRRLLLACPVDGEKSGVVMNF